MAADASYVVFARKRPDEALTRVGSVSAKDDQELEAAVTREHGEDWLELVAIPAGQIDWAIRED
jgi:hypothetical protein